VPALAGCVAWGAVGRIRKSPSATQAGLLGAALIVLANSRPFEGMLFGIVALLAVMPKLIKPALLVPFSGVMALGACATGYYNMRTTGSLMRFAYSLNRADYAVVDAFLWQPVRAEPKYNHTVMRDFYIGFEKNGYEAFVEHRTLQVFAKLSLVKAEIVWLFFIGPALTVPFLVGLVNCIRRGQRWAACAVAAVSGGLLLLVWPTNPHYFAPAAGCLFLLVVDGVRRICSWRMGNHAIAVLAVCVTMIPLRMVAEPLGLGKTRALFPMPWYTSEMTPFEERREVEQSLLGKGGKHLVIVRYSPGHSVHKEFVYNRADIDAAPIVWARELPSAEANQRLLRYYQDRKIWLLRPDESLALELYNQ